VGQGVAVVAFARNEADRIAGCLESVLLQTECDVVFVSDNGSSDGTGEIVRKFSDRIPPRVRTVADLGAMEHIVSAGRWGLAESSAPFFAFLAGDDLWEMGFLAEAVAVLRARPEVDVAYPTFVWEGQGELRRIEPLDLDARDGWMRQARALALPDSREVSNLIYGVYRRAAFARLLDGLERGGEAFGADYAAVIHLLGTSRAAAAPAAVGRRFERAGADLVERVGITRGDDDSLLRKAALYARITARVNSALGRAVARSTGRSPAVTVPATFVVRAPAWVIDATTQFRKQS